MKLRAFCAAVAAFAILTAGAAALDMELSPYKAVSGLAGKLRSVGSDTMLHEMELWAEGFQSIYPNAKIDITANSRIRSSSGAGKSVLIASAPSMRLWRSQTARV